MNTTFGKSPPTAADGLAAIRAWTAQSLAWKPALALIVAAGIVLACAYGARGGHWPILGVLWMCNLLTLLAGLVRLLVQPATAARKLALYLQAMLALSPLLLGTSAPVLFYLMLVGIPAF